MIRKPRSPTLFPYTTLFRSLAMTVAGPGMQMAIVYCIAGAEVLFSVLLFFVMRLHVAAVKKDILARREADADRKSTRLNSSHMSISYAVFCLKKKKPVCLPA